MSDLSGDNSVVACSAGGSSTSIASVIELTKAGKEKGEPVQTSGKMKKAQEDYVDTSNSIH